MTVKEEMSGALLLCAPMPRQSECQEKSERVPGRLSV